MSENIDGARLDVANGTDWSNEVCRFGRFELWGNLGPRLYAEREVQMNGGSRSCRYIGPRLCRRAGNRLVALVRTILNLPPPPSLAPSFSCVFVLRETSTCICPLCRSSRLDLFCLLNLLKRATTLKMATETLKIAKIEVISFQSHSLQPPGSTH